MSRKISRRTFLSWFSGVGVSLALTGGRATAQAKAEDTINQHDSFACLVDLSVCIGCRRCEEACRESNGLSSSEIDYDDQLVFNEIRRLETDVYTTVNRCFTNKQNEHGVSLPTYVKSQCMHCLDPACVSACPVGAMTKKGSGEVVYDPKKCIGCRYCMIACPFQVPAFEYEKAILPAIKKCTFCHHKRPEPDIPPACAVACPVEAIGFGRRNRLIETAKSRISQKSNIYQQQIYGENEVGGTSWMYISDIPFSQTGLPQVPAQSIPSLSNSIQQLLYKGFWSPLFLSGILGGLMWVFNLRQFPQGNQNNHYNRAPFHSGFFSPGVLVLVVFMLVGAAFATARMTEGLGYVTNLSNSYPWGLWAAVDMAAGVALSAGGFTLAFLIYILGREKYLPLFRAALLTALLGYTFEGIAAILELGRYQFMWHPLILWQPDSPLFAVSICVIAYLGILYSLLIPIAAEEYGEKIPALNWLAEIVDKFLGVFLLIGVVVSCFHQASVGSLMLLAPNKLHPLWYTPMLPVFFLLSAIVVGFPMIVFESIIAANTFKRKSDMKLFTPLGKVTYWLLTLYLLLRGFDFVKRGLWEYLVLGSTVTNCFLTEIIIGGLLPLVLLKLPWIRNSRSGIFAASTLIVFGIIMNRVNVFLVGFSPLGAKVPYFPSIGEIAVTCGLIAGLLFCYRCGIAFLPLLHARDPQNSHYNQEP